MISLFLAALLFTAHQGTAVQVKVPNEPGLKSVEVIWQKKTVPAFRAGDAWTTILGVDLDAKPGAHEAEAVLTRDDGRVEKREITIDVEAKSYPREPLKVGGKFVELSKADLARSQRENREVGAIYRR